MKKYLYRVILIIFTFSVLYVYINNTDRIENVNVNDNFNDFHKSIIDNNGSYLHIYYFDVGEADSTLIKYKNYNILIDGGNTVDGVLLVPFFKEIGIDHFDYVFATHAHEDHIGGLSRVIYNFPVNHFYMPDHKAEWKSYNNLTNALDSKNVSLESPKVGETYEIDDLLLKVLWIDNKPEDYNENSIALKLIYHETSYLFMADLESDVEHILLDSDLKSDVLKVGHHGSKYSSSAVFLEAVHPKYAVISCGANNMYNHPHQIVLDKLNRINSYVYRTDLNHTIHLISNGSDINFEFIDRSFNGGDLG